MAVLPPGFQRLHLHDATELSHHSITFDLSSGFKLVERQDPSLTVPLRYWKVVINVVSGVAYEFATLIGTSNRGDGRSWSVQRNTYLSYINHNVM